MAVQTHYSFLCRYTFASNYVVITLNNFFVTFFSPKKQFFWKAKKQEKNKNDNDHSPRFFETINYIYYSFFLKPFFSHSIFYHKHLQFTVLYLRSLPSLSILNFCIDGLYGAISKVSAFLCPWKVLTVFNENSTWTWLNFYKKISTKKFLKINLCREKKNYPKYLSRHIYYQFFSQTKKSTNRFQREACTNKKDLWREISTK